MPDAFKNMLYYGDNLKILKHYIPTQSIDLIYLDPPFKSNQDYNVLFAEPNGSQSAAQVRAFEDTWHWDKVAAENYHDVVKSGGKVADAMVAFERMLGHSDMFAYLSMMAPRLIDLHRVLKPSGSICLHCDPTASHYLKILMDSIFSPQSFRNEIIWHYSGWNKPLKDHIERRHDIILFYSQTNASTFNAPMEPYESREQYLKIRKQKVYTDDSGLEYTLDTRDGGERQVRVYVDEALERGKPLDDVWDLDKINNSSKERLGYPTQKPEALLERIIQMGSDEEDIVLDPFCGCGTTIAVAQKLNRRWIGIDVTHLSIALIRHRLKTAYGDKIINLYKVIGEPESLPDAQDLAKQDPYQFQWWALGLVGARPIEQKKGADKGIDGRLYFYSDGTLKGKVEQIIFSVKSGHVTASHVRDLIGVVNREKAALGVFITMESPTRPMREESASGGFYQSGELGAKKYSKIQILTIEELFAGKKIDCPPFALEEGNATLKRAQKVLPPKQKAKHASFDKFG